MTDIDDEPYEWDENRSAISPDQSMSVLEQLQLYQHMARHVYPFLDTYETCVLVQLVDRITGWKKHEARFSADALFVGDAMYDGLARVMDRSRMMKALASLESRGLIRRRPQRGSRIRIYWINTEPDPETLLASAPPLKKSAARASARRRLIISNGDNVVAPADWVGSEGDLGISQNDTGEGYRENGIRNSNLENTTHPEPSAPGARSFCDFSTEVERPAQARGVARPEIRPRTRRRAPS